MKPTGKHRLYLLSIVGLSILLAACSGDNSAGGQESAAEVALPPGAIRITAEEFDFTFDPAAFSAGSNTVVVENEGHTEHDFAIRGNGLEEQTEVLAAGESAELTLDLQPGTYTYLCTVPGHEQLGMTGTFTIP